MELWLRLPAREMTIDEKRGRIGPRLYPRQYIDTRIINWEWLRRFSQVEQGVQQVLSNLGTTNARKELIERFRNYLTRVGFKFQSLPFLLNLSLNPVDLHSDWQFQFAEVGYTPIVMDDLYGSLGNFAVYAAVTKAKIYKQSDKKYFVNVSEVGLYVRDTFDFIGPQYLGHWSKEGMGLVLAGGIANSTGVEWKLPGLSPELGIVQPLNNSDFRAFRNNFGVGGDLLLFSDVRTQAVNIGIEVPV